MPRLGYKSSENPLFQWSKRALPFSLNIWPFILLLLRLRSTSPSSSVLRVRRPPWRPPLMATAARSLSFPLPSSSSNLSLSLPFAFFFVPLSSRRPRRIPARLAAIHGCDGRRCYLRSQASTLCEFSSLIFYIFFTFRQESERIRNGLGCLGLGILESVRGSINFTS